MPRIYPSRLCKNPDCSKQFRPKRRNQIFCNENCRTNFNNDLRREKNLTDYVLEKTIRQNERILKKALLSPVCKDDEIKIEFLIYDHFNFDISSDSSANKESGRIIRWCHTHGIEPKDPDLKTFVIHKRHKLN